MIWSDMDAIRDGARLVQTRYLRTMYSAYEQFTSEHRFSRSEQVTGSQLGMTLPEASVTLLAGDLSAPMIMGNLVHTSTILLTRQRFEQVKAFREDLRLSGEDYDFHLRTCRAGTVAFVDIPTIGYTVGMADQLTRPSLQVFIAKNTRKTIEPIIAEDRDEKRLPAAMVRWAMAGGQCLDWRRTDAN